MSKILKNEMEIIFYYVHDEHCFNRLKNHADKIDVLIPVAYDVDRNGFVKGGVEPSVLELSSHNSFKIMPIVHNEGFNQGILTSLLDNKTARKRMIEFLKNECLKNDFVGIQFDFENLPISHKDKFSQLCYESSRIFHSNGFKFSIAVVPRSSEYPGSTEYLEWMYNHWRGGYDYKELCNVADFISVMTYAQHTRRTPPGPNAGIPWTLKNMQFILEKITPEKFSLGIPVISQHWKTDYDTEKFHVYARTWSWELKYVKAQSMVSEYNAKIHWLDEQKVNFSYFENEGIFEYIFFEDFESFKHKLNLVIQYNLRGISAWAIGYEDERIWDLLSSTS